MSAATAEARARAHVTHPVALGEIIDGRYRVEALLGGGGMASVYRATHLGLDQHVAVKVIAPALLEQPGMAERFFREARAATHLRSDHVARVRDLGTTAGGAPYMVLEPSPDTSQTRAAASALVVAPAPAPPSSSRPAATAAPPPPPDDDQALFEDRK